PMRSGASRARSKGSPMSRRIRRRTWRSWTSRCADPCWPCGPTRTLIAIGRSTSTPIARSWRPSAPRAIRCPRSTCTCARRRIDEHALRASMEALMSAIKAICQTWGFALALLLPALARAEPAVPSDVMAIDVLIEPDATMISNAQAINARMRQSYPQGYTLDQTHTPHITVVQAFVHGRDFAKVTAAVSKAVRSSPALPLQLKATGYNVAEAAGVGVVAYSIERSLELAQLASRIVEAVRPFVATTGGGPDAFAKVPGEQINGDTIEWVTEYAT